MPNSLKSVLNVWHEVRFHLSEGDHYKHWQIKTRTKGEHDYTVRYYDPFQYQLVLSDCELINYPKKAQRVYKKQRRDVCGWVKCKSISVQTSAGSGDALKMVVYDPKVKTYWHYENDDNNIDGATFDELITFEKRIYQKI